MVLLLTDFYKQSELHHSHAWNEYKSRFEDLTKWYGMEQVHCYVFSEFQIVANTASMLEEQERVN